MADDTPWGPAQHRKSIADGIIHYETASHGGIKISEDRYRAMPKKYRAHKPWAGHLWYEEDVDWCIIALAYPDEYFAEVTEAQRDGLLEIARKTYEESIAPELEPN